MIWPRYVQESHNTSLNSEQFSHLETLGYWVACPLSSFSQWYIPLTVLTTCVVKWVPHSPCTIMGSSNQLWTLLAPGHLAKGTCVQCFHAPRTPLRLARGCAPPIPGTLQPQALLEAIFQHVLQALLLRFVPWAPPYTRTSPVSATGLTIPKPYCLVQRFPEDC